MITSGLLVLWLSTGVIKTETVTIEQCLAIEANWRAGWATDYEDVKARTFTPIIRATCTPQEPPTS